MNELTNECNRECPLILSNLLNIIVDKDILASRIVHTDLPFLFLFSEIDVVCRRDYIEVSLKISDFPGLVVNGSSLHLEDKNCVPGYKDGKMMKFEFGLEDCKTKQVDDGEKIYYKNKVYLKAGVPPEDDAITREHMEIIPFSCGYDKKTTLSKVSYNPRSVIIITDTGNVIFLVLIQNSQFFFCAV